jgi:hypothetical protein
LRTERGESCLDRGGGVGRRAAGHPVGGGDGTDRAGVAADRGVLQRPGSCGVSGVQPEGRGSAPVPVAARQEQRYRRGHPGPAAAARPARVGAAEAARIRAGRVGPAGTRLRPAEHAGRRTQGPPQRPGPATDAAEPVDRRSGPGRPCRARAVG